LNNLDNKKDITSRRKFLKKVWTGLGIVAGLELGIVSLGFLFSSNKNNLNAKGSKLVAIGNISDFDLDAVYPFRNGKFYLVRLKDGGFIALSLKCTHLGCSVIWDENNSRFNCPCHSSSFDMYGNVIDPPAPRALDMYPVMVEEGILKVDTRNPKRRRSFDKKQVVYV